MVMWDWPLLAAALVGRAGAAGSELLPAYPCLVPQLQGELSSSEARELLEGMGLTADQRLIEDACWRAQCRAIRLPREGVLACTTLNTLLRSRIPSASEERVRLSVSKDSFYSPTAGLLRTLPVSPYRALPAASLIRSKGHAALAVYGRLRTPCAREHTLVWLRPRLASRARMDPQQSSSRFALFPSG